MMAAGNACGIASGGGSGFDDDTAAPATDMEHHNSLTVATLWRPPNGRSTLSTACRHESQGRHWTGASLRR
jgi:hypothetical protein